MDDLVKRVIELAIQTQQIPAPTFDEGKRADFICALFAREGLDHVSKDDVGNVYGCLKVPDSRSEVAKPLIISAHLDTVFPLDTDLRIAREPGQIHGPGLGDNSLGVAALFGLLWMLRDAKLERAGDIWFVANVGEEGLGDLRGMKRVVERFGGDVQVYLVLEGLALGHIYHRAVGVKRYRVTARTTGGHSWSDYGKPSAIHELAKLVVQFSSLKLPSQPRTTMNVGKISGGTSVNVIASEANLDLDLRSEGDESLAELISTVEQLIHNANTPEVRVEAEVIGQRPAGYIDPSHPLIELAEDCVREVRLTPILTAGSTDANVPLSKGFPAVVLGVSTGGGAHTVHEFINTEPVALGMEQLVKFVQRVWKYGNKFT
ncbi:MAG TPA: M20/M25/M40 family metallo-hydrolase [Anaerolineales bacterium]|nr:M20/M25/M40 family metallo-hydrolase [Anaerolineales bacterium]